MVLRDRIRGHRRRFGISQEELATRAGLSTRTIRYIESGQTVRPRPATLRLIAAGLGVGVDEVDPEPAAHPRTPITWPPAPAQLPADTATFVGRTTHLAALAALLPRSGPARQVLVAALSGAPGAGKTALAVRFAHRVADRFPDGQLYADLRGSTPEPARPATVLRDLLDALGVPAHRLPSSADARTGLYRSLLAERRLTVLLDDARDDAQAHPLLPTTPGSLGLVTSRSALPALAVQSGAHPVTVGPLSRSQARALLTARIGAARAEAEPDAVRALADRCSGLPVALVLAAAHVADRPEASLARLVDEAGPALAERLLAPTLGAGDGHCWTQAQPAR